MKVKTEAFSFRFGKICITYGLTTFAWIFFRAKNWDTLLLYFNRMLTRFNPWMFSYSGLEYLNIQLDDILILFFFLLILFAVDLIREIKKQDFGEWINEQNLWFRWTVIMIMIVGIVVFGEYGIHFDSAKFIYFDF